MTVETNPKWWRDELDVAWEKARHGLKRGWARTRQYPNGRSEPNRGEIANDMLGKGATEDDRPPGNVREHDEYDEAHRFGVGARIHYGSELGEWTPALEGRLRRDWDVAHSNAADAWLYKRDAVRFGWEYSNPQAG